VCRTKPDTKGKYIKIILALLQSPSAAVTYECAVTLTSLSQAPTAVRAAANCYCQLLVSQSDNNVKLIVLDRLQELKDKHRDVMQVRARGGWATVLHGMLWNHQRAGFEALLHSCTAWMSTALHASSSNADTCAPCPSFTPTGAAA
jgi:hypothetical protein